MNINEFYVSIQTLCEKAKDAGFSLEWIDNNITEALIEWLEEEGYYDD